MESALEVVEPRPMRRTRRMTSSTISTFRSALLDDEPVEDEQHAAL